MIMFSFSTCSSILLEEIAIWAYGTEIR